MLQLPDGSNGPFCKSKIHYGSLMILFFLYFETLLFVKCFTFTNYPKIILLILINYSWLCFKKKKDQKQIKNNRRMADSLRERWYNNEIVTIISSDFSLYCPKHYIIFQKSFRLKKLTLSSAVSIHWTQLRIPNYTCSAHNGKERKTDKERHVTIW